jgi:hypothetical protein
VLSIDTASITTISSQKSHRPDGSCLDPFYSFAVGIQFAEQCDDRVLVELAKRYEAKPTMGHLACTLSAQL